MTREEYFTNNFRLAFHGEALHKAVIRVIENQDRFYSLLRSTNEPGIDRLISSIHNSSFFRAHSHSHHHYQSGLVEHSLGVYDQMVRISTGLNISDHDMILTGLLHDICMAHNYNHEWPHVRGGHGRLSRRIVEMYLPNLSQEVKIAIEKHRHTPHGEDVGRHPLWALVRNADMADAATSPKGTWKFMELSLGHKEDVMDNLFNKWKILSLLKATKRENIHHLCKWLEKESSFFEAPASKSQHNVFRGGLAKHSMDVYREAMELNQAYGLSVDSVTLCALLHDVCKHDQFTIDNIGKPQRLQNNIDKGHGLRSVMIITQTFGVPLSDDETMAIWWHMGQHEESLNMYPDDYAKAKDLPLVQLINKADGIAAAKAKEG